MPRTLRRKKAPPAPVAPPPVATVPERYTPRMLVRVAAWIAENPTGVIEVRNWTRDRLTAAAWRRWFSKCLADKINARDPNYPDNRKTKAGKPWRKAAPEYATELTRLRPYVGSRLAIGKHTLAWCVLGERVKMAMSHRFPRSDDE